MEWPEDCASPLKNVISKASESIKIVFEQGDVRGDIQTIIDIAQRIFVVVDTLETNQPNLISTASLVAQVAEGLTQGQSTVAWNKVGALALQHAIENLEGYLDNAHKSFTQIKANKADQAKYAPGIGNEMRKHNKAIEKAASVLQLGLGASLTDKIDPIHGPKIKSIASVKKASLDWHLSSYPSKFDAFLDSSIQIKRTSQLYFHDVAFRNRSHRDETTQTLEELKKLVDENKVFKTS
ncbi:hypothetical protein AC1031_018095 [Aphanomyces cochlioides]|nr:hypothetical protein AC1031_018095 [Aphanomyces cochlioides]